MEKVTLTKEQAQAIKEIKKNDPVETIVTHIRCGSRGWTSELKPLNGMEAETLIRALYHPDGYDIELTEHEKIQELWEYPIVIKANNDWYKEGITDTLKTLGREDLIPKE